MRQNSRLAASVILLKPSEKLGFEVFLMRRPGEAYGFPVGALRKEDCHRAMLDRTVGLTPHRARQILGAQFNPREALGLWVAAARELFEAAGILLAVDQRPRYGTADSPERTRLKENHATSLPDFSRFRSRLDAEKRFCNASALIHFSHWQAPPEEANHFDTHFFLAVLPADQSPSSNSPEIVQSLWLTPDRGLELFGKGRMPMMFSTFASLRTLADFATIESVWKEFSAKS